jgi:hypothetical protein
VRILITGSRNWTDREAIVSAIAHAVGVVPASEVVVVHGAAPGADTLAADYARVAGYRVEAHPAYWDQFGRAAGHRRNAEMVALGADTCLAFALGPSPGTRGCMAMAVRAGIRVVDHDPALEVRS